MKLSYSISVIKKLQAFIKTKLCHEPPTTISDVVIAFGDNTTGFSVNDMYFGP